MKKYFAYIRVSTAKQGEGVSLQEQRDAIERHATQHNIQIKSWFEEKETAAKRGRTQFSRMMRILRKGEASGAIIHKIDRSARNLRDWADLGELLDAGVDVRFAHENLDLSSRGGRLSADLQAVIAADYIRNLREEVRKGFYGRLKQGIYPMPAPIGYRDMGAGKAKEPDPVMAPLVRRAFALYSTGQHSVSALSRRIVGLRGRNGRRLSKNGWCNMLSNPFYIGLIRLKKTGQVFEGAHEPIVKNATFEQVQAVLSGKSAKRTTVHDFLLRQRIKCRTCRYSLVGERQKGRVYYRCHQSRCPTTSIREDKAEKRILQTLNPLTLTAQELAVARKRVMELESSWESQQEKLLQSLTLSLSQLSGRMDRLTDALVDGAIDRFSFEQRKKTLLMEKKDLEEKQREIVKKEASVPSRVAEYLELAKSAWVAYKLGNPDERRDLLQKLTSNCTADGKILTVELKKPFDMIANRAKLRDGGPRREAARTIDCLLGQLAAFAQGTQGS